MRLQGERQENMERQEKVLAYLTAHQIPFECYNHPEGKTIEEALQLTNKAVAEALDGLPPVKMHGSLLAEAAIRAAIEDYQKKPPA